jgi:ferredoxin
LNILCSVGIIEVLVNIRIVRGFSMKVRIEDTCTACGLCVDTCPDVFEMADDIAQVIVEEVPEGLEDDVRQAAEECPSESIIVE